ncbi:MAG: type II secretion system protein [Candidatus Aminicenantes bacterium]|nr:type II secretion system protein [Candidatus Aminicenantes bacterium]
MIIKSNNKGYSLLAAILAITIFSILVLAARAHWETEIRRDLEEELIFRARQYVIAIERYVKKNHNRYPENLDILLKKKCIRKKYPDPMSESGTWNIVMRSLKAGTKKLIIVPEEYLGKLRGRARIIGVCSTSRAESYREYRKKKQYHEWAIYLGEKVEEEMPKLEFINF